MTTTRPFRAASCGIAALIFRRRNPRCREDIVGCGRELSSRYFNQLNALIVNSNAGDQDIEAAESAYRLLDYRLAALPARSIGCERV